MDIKFMLHSPAAQHPPQGRGTFYRFAKGAAQAAAPVPPLIPSPRGAGIQGQSVLLPRGAPPPTGYHSSSPDATGLAAPSENSCILVS